MNYFTTAAASIAGANIIGITEENHDNHGSVKTLRDVYQGTHFEFNRVRKDKVPKALWGGDPGVPPKLLKKVAYEIAPSLMTLYNSCIELGKWPCAWKMGEWTPVFQNVTDSRRRNIVPSRPLSP